jgi:hypothetical protein
VIRLGGAYIGWPETIVAAMNNPTPLIQPTALERQRFVL